MLSSLLYQHAHMWKWTLEHDARIGVCRVVNGDLRTECSRPKNLALSICIPTSQSLQKQIAQMHFRHTAAAQRLLCRRFRSSDGRRSDSFAEHAATPRCKECCHRISRPCPYWAHLCTIATLSPCDTSRDVPESALGAGCSTGVHDAAGNATCSARLRACRCSRA